MLQTVEPEKSKPTKADRTRARLIEVAKRLYQEHGSDQVTVRRIAAAAKIEAGSIYYHFKSRDEIMRAVLESGVGGARDEVMRAITEVGRGSSPLVRLRAALGAHLKYTLREHLDLSVVRMLVLGALTWVAEWYDPNGPMTPDDVADELMKMLSSGIAKGGAKP